MDRLIQYTICKILPLPVLTCSSNLVVIYNRNHQEWSRHIFPHFLFIVPARMFNVHQPRGPQKSSDITAALTSLKFFGLFLPSGDIVVAVAGRIIGGSRRFDSETFYCPWCCILHPGEADGSLRFLTLLVLLCSRDVTGPLDGLLFC